MRNLVLGFVITLMYLPVVLGQAKVSDADAAALKTTALDYIEGWYEGNAERMERAVHSKLAKRRMITNSQNGESQLSHQDAATLVEGTRYRASTPTPKAQQQKDVTILDVYENAAVVKVVAADWVDYLQMARWNGRWVIVNVLWELKPRPTP